MSEPLVPVTPWHSVHVSEEYLAFIRRAPRQDLVLRTLVNRSAGNLPLMTAEIVIAGEETRAKHPLAQKFPLHFRKTYFPAHMHGDPVREFENQRLAASILRIPEPIGATRNTFRACLLPGEPLSRHTPFGNTPPDSNVWVAEKLEVPKAAGLWNFVESAAAQLLKLHEGGLCHGDAELHNFVVCTSPLGVLPIDFEQSATKDSLELGEWQKRCRQDLEELLKEAIYLQCALGRQWGPIADMAMERLPDLFEDAGRFRDVIERRTARSAD